MPLDVLADERVGIILRRQNPWWGHVAGAGLLPDVPKYARAELDEVAKSLGGRQAYALIGARQIGKTTMLMQLAARLAAGPGDPRRIMYVSLDEPLFASNPECLRDILEWYVTEIVMDPLGGIGERILVMLDEAQSTGGWKIVLKRWVDMGYNVKFVVAASTSEGILGGAPVPLTGRMAYREIMPLSFAESATLRGLGGAARAGAGLRGELERALAGGDAGAFHAAARSAHLRLAGHADALRALLSEYMVYGGRPGVAAERDAGKKRRRLDECVQLALRDISRSGAVKRPAAMDALLWEIARGSPQDVSLGGLSGETGASRETTRRHLALLKSACLVQDAELYSKSPLVRARAGRRARIGDPGTRTAALRSLASDMLTDPAEAARVAEAVVCDHAVRLSMSYDDVAGGRACYWRDGGGGVKVDAVALVGGRALPVESRYSRRTRESDLRGAKRFAEGHGAGVGLVVSDEEIGLADGGIVTIPLWLYLLMC